MLFHQDVFLSSSSHVTCRSLGQHCRSQDFTPTLVKIFLSDVHWCPPENQFLTHNKIEGKPLTLVYFSQCSEILKRTLEILYLGIYLNMKWYKWFHETMRDLVTCSPWKYKFAPENQLVGRWCSFWDGLFSGAILVWGRVDQHLLETFFSWTPSLVCVFSARLVSS